jgi:cell division septation protein DedD
MHEDFNEDELPRVEQRRDTELTLGPMMLLGFFFGLVLLCGLCFAVGYSMGSRGAHETSTLQPGAGTASQAAGSVPKPSAERQNMPQPQPAADIAPAPAHSAASAQLAPTLPATATQSEPGAETAGALMVQIATVSHQEDADVLVGALHQRGYTATARRDPADNQFHVRIGPFNSRNDANAMSKKLLRDGYNAVVQP